MLDTLKSGKRTVGVKQVGRALKNGQAQMVFLARDADPNVTEPVAITCQRQEVPCEWVDSMVTLGKACGISVGSAVAALVE